MPLAKTGFIYNGRLENGYGFAPFKQDLITLKNSLICKRVFSFYERITI